MTMTRAVPGLCTAMEAKCQRPPRVSGRRCGLFHSVRGCGAISPTLNPKPCRKQIRLGLQLRRLCAEPMSCSTPLLHMLRTVEASWELWLLIL